MDVLAVGHEILEITHRSVFLPGEMAGMLFALPRFHAFIYFRGDTKGD